MVRNIEVVKCNGDLKTKSQLAKEKKNMVVNPLVRDLPYPYAPTKKDKKRQYVRFLEIFKRLQVNVPFL